jgi:hypothetical protein
MCCKSSPRRVICSFGQEWHHSKRFVVPLPLFWQCKHRALRVTFACRRYSKRSGASPSGKQRSHRHGRVVTASLDPGVPRRTAGGSTVLPAATPPPGPLKYPADGLGHGVRCFCTTEDAAHRWVNICWQVLQCNCSVDLCLTYAAAG